MIGIKQTMKPKLLLCLALVLCGGLFGCATQSQHTTQTDRAHALEAALRYEFNRWDQATHNREHIIEDGESVSWLVREFHNHNPPVFSFANHPKSNADGFSVWWSAKIQEIGEGHATIYLKFYNWTESQGGYILELRREKRQWIVDSEKDSQTGF